MIRVGSEGDQSLGRWGTVVLVVILLLEAFFRNSLMEGDTSQLSREIQ